ncbi:MAG: GHKL domain-containing protein [Candidatus Altiarchaeota archaeon]|nr:GHKL domain-containing protein [Candidatus Altiarchaeota archaeon]
MRQNKEDEIDKLKLMVETLTKRETELEERNTLLKKKVEERTRQLRETRDQLIQSAKMATIGTLAGGIAHEINNPLGVILTNTQMLLAEEQEPDERDSLELIEEGARRCRDIVVALLKYSRKPELDEHYAVNINYVIDDACALLRHQLDRENVHIRKDYCRLPVVEGNANELQQVFTNLILNAKDAIKRMRSEGEIIIKTSWEDDHVVVEVADNGCGIPEENFSKVFDPFFTTKDVGKGTGLGLAITYKVVEKHRGRIEVSSKLGIGTTFKIKLPCGE